MYVSMWESDPTVRIFIWSWCRCIPTIRCLAQPGEGIWSGIRNVNDFRIQSWHVKLISKSIYKKTHLESARSIPWVMRNTRSYCRDVFVSFSRNDRGAGYVLERYWCCPRIVTSFGKASEKGHVYWPDSLPSNFLMVVSGVKNIDRGSPSLRSQLVIGWSRKV